MGLLNYKNFALVIDSLNFVRLLHLEELLIMILPAIFEIFFRPWYLVNTVSQIKGANLTGNLLVSYDVSCLFTNIPLQKTINIANSFCYKKKLSLFLT